MKGVVGSSSSNGSTGFNSGASSSYQLPSQNPFADQNRGFSGPYLTKISSSESSSTASGGGLSSYQQQHHGTSYQSSSLRQQQTQLTLLRSANQLSNAGLTGDQQQRFLSLLQGSSSVHVGARLRALELFHFWSALDSTQRVIEDTVNIALAQAGLRAGLSPKAPAFKRGSPEIHHFKPLTSDANTSAAPAQSKAATATTVASGGDPLEQQASVPLLSMPEQPAAKSALVTTNQQLVTGAKNTSSSSGGGGVRLTNHDSDMELNIVIGMEDLPTTSTGTQHNSAGSAHEEGSPKRRNRTTFAASRSPRAGGFLSGSSIHHIVDEVDAAHARGALSPRAVSPNMQLNQDAPCVPHSPLDMGLSAPNPAALVPSHSSLAASVGSGADGLAASNVRRNNSPLNLDSSGHTPRRIASEVEGYGRPSRSPSPSARANELGEISRASSTHSIHSAFANPFAVVSPQPVVEKRFASYQDIPRFYFVEGKPQTQSHTLIGPHSNKHDNPHLTLFEGVPLPMAAQQQMMMIALENQMQQQQHGNSPTGQGPNGMPQLAIGPKLSPMLPLAVMEDEDVVPFIQREFGRMPAPPPRAQPQNQRVAVPKGISSLRRPTTSSGTTQSKQEALYRQALVATMHRICTQAFGLPRYFASLVMKKLVADADAQNGGDDVATGRPGTASASSASQGIVTATQVKEFYEKHLRFKSIVRRLFEVLIATSKAGSVSPGASAGSSAFAGALGGVSASTPLPSSSTTSSSSPAGDRRNCLMREDFVAYIEVLLESHPGLGFLRQTSDFQAKYMETVIIRIFYDLDRHDRGRITWQEFENSKLPDAFRQVDATDDINTVLIYFSYEHFYVLYCRFWELDDDRDLLLSQQDLMKYGPEGTMNPKIAERIFQGVGRKLTCKVRGKMNYEDFVWFCLSEEDKSSARAIRYWFRILDLDGDGVICGYELETFYSHTKKQLIQMTTEGIAFTDVICQIKDMMPYSSGQGITLGDMLAYPQAAFVAFNMIFNVVKFLQFEQRDPFVAHHDRLVGGFEKNEWDRFARAEYDRMAQEADGEGAN